MTGKEETIVQNKKLRHILSGLMLSILVIGLAYFPRTLTAASYIPIRRQAIPFISTTERTFSQPQK